MAKVEFSRIFGISYENKFLPLVVGMLIEYASGSAVLLPSKFNSFAAFSVELMRKGLMPCGATVELKFHGVIKFHCAIVSYAAVNGDEACPKGRGTWGVNTNPTSASVATGIDPTSVAATTGEWEAVAYTGIADVPIFYAVGANNDAASVAVCLD